MATRVKPRVTSPRATVTEGMVSTSRHWVLSSELCHIAPVVDDIVAMCREAGFSPRLCRLNVPIAVTEALSNAMLKGNCGNAALCVELRVEIDGERLLVEVCDQGCGFTLDAVVQSPNDEDWFEREDGRGIFLMRQLMDRVENSGIAGQAGHQLRLILHKA